MAEKIHLTRGFIANAMRGDDSMANSVIQILSMKSIVTAVGQTRFRLQISDGEYSHTFAMLAFGLNYLVSEKTVEPFAVVRVKKMACSEKSDKKVIIITSLDVLVAGRDVGHPLGNPVPWNDQASQASQVLRPFSFGDLENEGGNFVRPTRRPPQTLRQSTLSDYMPGSSSTRISNTVSAMAVATGGAQLYRPSDQISNGISNSGGRGGHLGGVSRKEGQRMGKENCGSAVNDEDNIVPIRDVNPYINGKITIRARVINKGKIIPWSNLNGSGKLFSMDLSDGTGEIRMTGFNEAVDKFYEMIELNHVYTIANFNVRGASSYSKGHDSEISFNPETQIVPCVKNSSDIPFLTFDFVRINEIENAVPDKIIDVIGLCKAVQPVQTITARTTGKKLRKRELTLVDMTCKLVSLTLWGSQAEDFNEEEGSLPIIAVRGAKVSDFNGRSLSVLSTSIVQINPDLPAAHSLRGWYENEGYAADCTNISVISKYGRTPWMMIAEANEIACDDKKPKYFMAKVKVMAIKSNPVYRACTTDKCNRKVVEVGNGWYRCEKCVKELPGFTWRLNLQVNFGDFSGDFWTSCFAEIGETILGKTADSLAHLSLANPEEFNKLMKNATFQQYIGKFRARMETYNNEIRKKIDVVELQTIDHAEYAKHLLAELQESNS